MPRLREDGLHSVYVARGRFNDRSVVLYVGCTSRGLARFHEHARTARWWKYMTTTTWHHRASREAALKTERLMIEKYKPLFN